MWAVIALLVGVLLWLLSRTTTDVDSPAHTRKNQEDEEDTLMEFIIMDDLTRHFEEHHDTDDNN